MEQRLAHLEATVRELAHRVEDIQRRIAAFEAGAAQPVGPSPSAPPVHVAASVERPASDLPVLLAFAGRSLLVLGGAYLLRALTESGVLSPAVGPLLGLFYAGAWLLAVGWTGGPRREANAAFHATTASVIGFPLIWEATVRFGVLRPSASAVALGALTGVALGVAWRRNQRSLAWIVTLGALVTAVALIPASGAALPYAVFLLLLGLATLWLGYVCDWTVLRWPVALVANVVALGLVSRALSGTGSEGTGPVLALLSALVAGYLASTAARTLFRGREVIPFEITQTGLALLIGFGGAIAVSRATGVGAHQLGAISLVLAFAAYVVAFAFMRRMQGGVNFFFYTSLALVFALVGGGLLLGPAAMVPFTAVLAVASAWLGGRAGQPALQVQAAIYLIAGGVFSGLLAIASRVLVGGAGPSAAWSPASAAIVVLAAAVCTALSARRETADRPAAAVAGTLATLVLLGWGAAGFVVALLATWQSAIVHRPLGPGEIGTMGTAVLSAMAILLAGASRARLVEAGWLVYPVLLVTGAKVVVVDLRHSSALLLVAAFVTYGIALIVAPRVLRARGSEHPTPPAVAAPPPPSESTEPAGVNQESASRR